MGEVRVDGNADQLAVPARELLDLLVEGAPRQAQHVADQRGDVGRPLLVLAAPREAEQLARQVVAFVQELRKLDLRKKPGIAETLDWAAALLRLEYLEHAAAMPSVEQESMPPER